MEAAGLALTVVSLYRACADIAEKIETYKAFKTDSDRLNAQFHAERQRFVAWGRLAGLVDAKKDQKLHQALLDDEVRSIVEGHLRVIEQILHANDKSAGSQGQSEPGDASSSWKRRIRVIRWVMKTKVERTAQLKLFCGLVQQLHNLVPVDNLKDDRLNGDCDVKENLLGLRGMSEELLEILRVISAETKAEDRKELNAWIMGQQFSDGTRENYGNAVERRLDGTCNWILKRKAFTRWCGQEPTSKVSKFLWIHGPAGFGKTVLCAHMIKHLLSLEIGPVVHVFSEYGNFREDPYTAVRSWVSQLVAENNIAYELAKAKSEPDVNQAAPKSVVVELLGEILRAIPHSCLVLDGLDECLKSGPTKAASKFLQSLDCILAKTTTRILITSRDEPEIRSALVTLRYSELTEYKITPEDVHNDIQSYSQSIIDGNRKLSKQSQEFRDSLSQRMVDRCQGQFLWLKLQEEPLRRGRNRQHLQKLIEETPPGISNMYDRSWERIEKMRELDRQRTLSLLRLAACSWRPLTLMEITEAVLVDGDANDTTQDDFPIFDLPDEIDDGYINTEISELCGQLLEIRQPLPATTAGMRTVHLAHFTVKEFLLGKLSTEMHRSSPQVNGGLCASIESLQHAIIARTCLRYLGFRTVWGPLPLRTDDVTFEAAFRHYVTYSWSYHVKAGASPYHIDTVKLAMGFLCESHPTWLAWRAWFDAEEAKRCQAVGTSWVSRHQPTGPIYQAVRLCLTSVALKMIEATAWDEEQRSRHGSVALYAACEQNDIVVTKALLHVGCDINSQNADAQTPLHLACLWGNLDVVKLLLSSGARHDIQDSRGATPIFPAASHDSTDTLALLIRHGADITVQDAFGWTPLKRAASLGFPGAVRLLISHGADVTVASNEGWTPISSAARHEKPEMIQDLLHAGANPNSHTKTGWTPLHEAIYAGCTEVARLLLNRGADVEVADELGWTPLCQAARRGMTEILEELLNRGANPNVETTEGRTPLGLSVQHGSTESVRLLLEHGADTNTRNKKTARYFRLVTPLWFAASLGHLGIAELLLDSGAAANAQDTFDEESPLHGAAGGGHAEVAQLLLERGADVNSRDPDGQCPTHVAAIYGHRQVLRVLLDAGANLAVTDWRKRRALNVATLHGQVDIVRLLLERETKSLDILRRAVRDAVRGGHVETTRLLLAEAAALSQSGLPRSTDPETEVACFLKSMPDLLAIAATWGQEAIAQMLLDYEGLYSVEARVEGQWTPLFYAVSDGHTKLAQTMLHYASDECFKATCYGRGLWSKALSSGDPEGMCKVLEDEAERRGVTMTMADGAGQITVLCFPG